MSGMRRERRRLAVAGFWAVALAALAGCQSPALRPTATPAPLTAGFHGTLPADVGPPQPVPAQWWTVFHDSILDDLETRTIAANYDLDVAEAHVREALAAWQGASGARHPSVEGDVEYRRQHEPSMLKNNAPLVNQYVITGVDVAWDADLFGRVRDLAAASKAGVDARTAAREELALTLTAEVARTYFSLRGNQQAQADLERAVQLADTAVNLIRSRMVEGVANGVDLAHARRAADAVRAELLPVQAAIDRDLLHLGVLTTQSAAALYAALGRPSPLPAEPAAPRLGQPADLLRARPDVWEAEAALRASSKLAAAATADLLPRLTFSGDLSFYAFGWGVGPRLTWDLFDRRRARARQSEAGARADAAYTRYQQVVLGAVNDVEGALAGLRGARSRRDVLRAAAADATAVAADARRRADLGVANRSNIVAAEQAEAIADATLAAQEAVVRESWVTLMQSLGGGVERPPSPGAP